MTLVLNEQVEESIIDINFTSAKTFCANVTEKKIHEECVFMEGCIYCTLV